MVAPIVCRVRCNVAAPDAPENNIKDTLRKCMALPEADVASVVVFHQPRQSAVDLKVNKSLTPGQEFVKIVATS